MADAQANKGVYKRMTAKLGSPSNSDGGIKASSNTPGGVYKRKSAGDATNGKATYTRKSAK